MKKLILLLVIACVSVSCDSLFELLELKVNNDLTENVEVSVPQTFGKTDVVDFTRTIDLSSGDLGEYIGKITAIEITAFNYKVIQFTGNTNGTISSGVLKFDDVQVSTITNLNISQAANKETVFQITDPTVISKLENTLLNNNSTVISLAGNASSDDGSMDFKIEVNISLIATIKE
mgnify:CR=1 FL=1